MEKTKILAIPALVLMVLVWQATAAKASFLDYFDNPGLISYTGSNSYGSGGSYAISGSKLNITTGADNTYSVMTSDTFAFNIGDTLSLYVPGISGTESVFLMCSTSAYQPDGITSFGFRFRRDGSGYARINLYPGGIPADTIDPAPAQPATLLIKRTSDTGFDYSIIINWAQINLGSFTLTNLSGIYALHIGAQAYKQTAGTTFSFDNLSLQIQNPFPVHNVTHDIWYGTIQGAINVADNGDQIEVAPGTYNESINFNGKAVRLFSASGPDLTTIGGNGAYHVVQCVSGENGGAILEGFSISQGNANGPNIDDRHGGGMFIVNSSPTVKNCIFSNNSAVNGGGGMWNEHSSPVVINCTFLGNSATDSGGGGMANFQSNPTVINCVFRANSAVNIGGGMDSSYYNNTTVINCTFSGNSAAFGGAIGNTIHSNLTVANSILWNDTQDEIERSYDSPVAISYSIVQNFDSYGDGNIDSDPCFFDASAGNLRLRPDSPCIDAGNNALVPPDIMTDMDSRPRFIDDPYIEDTGVGPVPIVDMGAYEFPVMFGSVNGKNVKLTLPDCNGNNVTFALTGGGYALIYPFDCEFSRLELYDTTEKSQLTVACKTGTSIGDIICFGPLKGIAAKNAELTGHITIMGDPAPVIGNSTPAATLVFGSGKHLTIESQMPLKSISASQWTNGHLYTSSLGSISIKGNKKLGLLGNLSINADVAGAVNSIKTAGILSGYLNCQSIKALTAPKIEESALYLSQAPGDNVWALGKLTVKGMILNTRILSKGNIGTVSAGSLVFSSCFAGVNFQNDLEGEGGFGDGVIDLPDPNAGAGQIDYDAPATIKSFTVKGIKGAEHCFVNSNIAAADILSVSLTRPDYNNGGVPFGLAADYIKKLVIKDPTNPVSLKELNKPGDAGGPYGNVEIRLYEP